MISNGGKSSGQNFEMILKIFREHLVLVYFVENARFSSADIVSIGASHESHYFPCYSIVTSEYSLGI